MKFAHIFQSVISRSILNSQHNKCFNNKNNYNTIFSLFTIEKYVGIRVEPDSIVPNKKYM